MPYLRNKRTGETIFVPESPQGVPSNQLKIQGEQASIANTQSTIADREADNAREDQKLAIAREAAKRASDAASAAQSIKQSSVNQRIGNLRALEKQIARVGDLYRKGPGATKGVSSVMDYLPLPANKQFDAAAAGLGEMGLAAFRVPGVGSQSDAELRAFIDANRPSASDYDVQIEEKLRNLRTRLAEAYKAQGVKYSPNASASPRNDGWKIERIGD